MNKKCPCALIERPPFPWIGSTITPILEKGNQRRRRSGPLSWAEPGFRPRAVPRGPWLGACCLPAPGWLWLPSLLPQPSLLPPHPVPALQPGRHLQTTNLTLLLMLLHQWGSSESLRKIQVHLPLLRPSRSLPARPHLAH